MTLLKLEQAIKPQFIWYKPEIRNGESEEEYLQRAARSHRFHVDEQRQHHKCLALILFVGLSHEYCIGEGRTIDYLDISEQQYSYFLTKYAKYLSKAKDTKEKGRKIDINQPYGRLFLKRGLVKNYLALN